MSAILDESAARAAAVATSPATEWQRHIPFPAPQFHRAVNIRETIDLRIGEASALVDAFDALAATMLLIDRLARIVHANTAGRVMLAEGSAIRVVCGKLKATDAQGNRALQKIVANLAAGDITFGSKDIFVPLTAYDDELYVAQVLPLTSSPRRTVGASHSVVAAVFIRKARLDLPNCREIIGNLYKLTPAEERVLAGVVKIGGVPRVASFLGIAETTVKTHLTHLFRKTGTKRQADLVKLVARFMSAIA